MVDIERLLGYFLKYYKFSDVFLNTINHALREQGIVYKNGEFIKISSIERRIPEKCYKCEYSTEVSGKCKEEAMRCRIKSLLFSPFDEQNGLPTCDSCKSYKERGTPLRCKPTKSFGKLIPGLYGKKQQENLGRLDYEYKNTPEYRAAIELAPYEDYDEDNDED